MPQEESAAAPECPATGHGRWWVAAAAILWSSSGLFVKSTMFLDWPADVRGIRLAFWRALFAGLLLIPAVRRPRLRLLMAPMIICFAGMNMSYLSAMTLGTAANAIWLQNTAPLWVMMFGVFALKEPFTRKQAVSTTLLLIGLLIILVPGLRGESPIGVLLGLVAGGFYAAVVLLLRALRDEDGAWLVVLNHLGAAVLIAPFMFAQSFVWPSAPQFGTLVLFGFFQMGLAYYCFSRGLRSVSGGDAALIALIEPLLVPVWAFAAAGELPSHTTAAGAGAILLGLLFQVVASAQFRRRANP